MLAALIALFWHKMAAMGDKFGYFCFFTSDGKMYSNNYREHLNFKRCGENKLADT